MTVRVVIQHETDDGEMYELANIIISRIEPTFDEAEQADYEVIFGHNNVEAAEVFTRHIKQFPRLTLNVLALVKSALSTLNPKDLQLDGELSGYMARRQPRTLRQIQAWADRLRDH